MGDRIVGLVRNRIHSIFMSILILPLFFVLIGNSLSFHSDLAADSGVNTSSSIGSDNQFHAAEDSHCEHKDLDPCADGFCHLGHCAKLVLIDVKLSAPLSFVASSFKEYSQSASELFLEGPFQPPRAVTA